MAGRIPDALPIIRRTQQALRDLENNVTSNDSSVRRARRAGEDAARIALEAMAAARRARRRRHCLRCLGSHGPPAEPAARPNRADRHGLPPACNCSSKEPVRRRSSRPRPSAGPPKSPGRCAASTIPEPSQSSKSKGCATPPPPAGVRPKHSCGSTWPTTASPRARSTWPPPSSAATNNSAAG